MATITVVALAAEGTSTLVPRGRNATMATTWERMAGAIQRMTTLPADPPTITGDGTRSAFWGRPLVGCFDTPVTVPAYGKPGAKGAAMLAAVGADRYPDFGAAVEAMSGAVDG